MKDKIIEYLDIGFAVVPVNHKVPVIIDWPSIDYDGYSCDIADKFFDDAKNIITGFGVILGGPNRQLSCMDIDSNDTEQVNRLLDSFPSMVRKIGKKGCTFFFITDGNQTKSQYRFPMNGGTVEIFYSNKQTVLPPSLHSGKDCYYWSDEACSLLNVGYDNLPVIPFHEIENIPVLLKSSSMITANINLPKGKQYDSNGNADDRYNLMKSFLAATVYKYNNRPRLSTVIIDCLNYDGEYFPNNSFFLNSKRPEMQTNDRTINCTAWVASMFKTYHKNTGATFAEESELVLETEDWQFDKIIPVDGKIRSIDKPIFDETIIPEKWRIMITNFSDSMGAPKDALLISHMVALGACLQGNKQIYPDRLDTSFFQRPNLAVGLVAYSGSKKSDVLSIATHRCNELDDSLSSVNSPQLLNEQASLEARLEALNKQKKVAAALGEFDQADGIFIEISQVQDQLGKLGVKGTTWLYGMGTVQKIILDGSRNQRTGLFFILDEFNQLRSALSKKGNEDFRTYLMTGIDGNKSFKSTTILRGTDRINKHFISMITTLQPDVLNSIIADLSNPKNDKNDGFQQRFQLMSMGEPKVSNGKPINMGDYIAELNIFNAAFHDNDVRVHVALDCMDEYNEMRKKINIEASRYYGKPVASYLYKHEGLLCRWAYNFEFILSDGRSHEINLEALKLAFKLLEYFADEIKYLFSVSDNANDIIELARIANMITNRFFPDGETVSQWYQKARGNNISSDRFIKVLNELERRSYIAKIRVGKVSEVIKVNPLVYSL